MGAEQQSIWLWRSDDDLWELFDAKDTFKINNALSSGDQGMVLQRRGPEKTYFIDFQRQIQTNVETGCQRRIVQVKPNSEWLRNTSHNLRESTWEKIPQRDALEMERALFARQDSAILERGSDVFYVDFTKWTQTNLTTGRTLSIKVKSEGLHRRDSSSSNVSAMSSSGQQQLPQQQQQHICCTHHQNSGNRRQRLPHHHHQQQQQHMEPQHRPSSPQTVTSLNYHSHHNDEEVIPFGAPVNESAKCRKFMNPQESPDHTPAPAIVTVKSKSPPSKSSGTSNSSTSNNMEQFVWHWRNDYGSWDRYDAEVMCKIEDALKAGEDSMMFMRESAPYFLDLVNFTQTNVSTGCTREIRRMQRTVQ